MSSNALRVLITGAILVVLSACGHEPVRKLPPATRSVPSEPAPAPAPRRMTRAEAAAQIARDQVGVPYRYGGSDRRGFDCSGLVQYAYSKVGMSVPRTTAAQWQGLDPVSRASLRPGDVVFFRIEGKISHVGMYLGGGRFVHAPETGRTVSVESLSSPFYANAFARGGRP